MFVGNYFLWYQFFTNMARKITHLKSAWLVVSLHWWIFVCIIMLAFEIYANTYVCINLCINISKPRVLFGYFCIKPPCTGFWSQSSIYSTLMHPQLSLHHSGCWKLEKPNLTEHVKCSQKATWVTLKCWSHWKCQSWAESQAHACKNHTIQNLEMTMTNKLNNQLFICKHFPKIKSRVKLVHV